uniref:non-specific serine/threonine protein kinase n=1 Tax=Strongyloides papillosus TaxID=174720 RepID=A0A0N5BHH3_STREA
MDGRNPKNHHHTSGPGLAVVIGCSSSEEEEDLLIREAPGNFIRNAEIDDDDSFLLHRRTSLKVSYQQQGEDSIIEDDINIIIPGHQDSSNQLSWHEPFIDIDGRQPFLSGVFEDLAIQRLDDGSYVNEVKAPKIVEGYLFGSILGQGSYGKVKEVVHEKGLQRRAVKIIKDRTLRRIPNGIENVKSEIDVMYKIGRHPHNVELFDVFRNEEKQKMYIIMEYCVTSLQQMLDSTPTKTFPLYQAQHYLKQLLSGLEYLHSLHIIHKDIKPGNLLLGVNGFLKISDFGVAEVVPKERWDNGNDWLSVAQGTPKFQPPEVASGAYKSFKGRPIDIWSSGVCLYNFVSGIYPFEGDVMMKLYDNITHQELEMPKDVELSEDLVELIRGILVKNPDERWDINRIKKSAWFNRIIEVNLDEIVNVPPLSLSSVDVASKHRPLSIYDDIRRLMGKDGHFVEDNSLQHTPERGLSFNECGSEDVLNCIDEVRQTTKSSSNNEEVTMINEVVDNNTTNQSSKEKSKQKNSRGSSRALAFLGRCLRRRSPS